MGDSYGAGIVAHLSQAELTAALNMEVELNTIEDGGKEPQGKSDNENDDDNNDPKDPGNGETIYPNIS